MQNTNLTPKNRDRSTLRIVSSRKVPGENKNPNPGVFLFLILLTLCAVGIGYHLIAGDPNSPIIINGDGEKALAPDRQRKLEKELDEIDHAMQYVLIATANKQYPCYACPNGTKSIFLNIGEVWKYGMTRKGEKGRYPGQNFGTPDITFLPQFFGTYSECLKREKIMIYNYPLLPEAQSRKIQLFRPPGNAYDK